MKVTCTSCKRSLSIPDKFAGKNIKCPACEAVVAVPVIEMVEHARDRAIDHPHGTESSPLETLFKSTGGIVIVGAAIQLIGFFLPWADFTLFSIGGYQVPSKLQALALEEEGGIWVVRVFLLLYLIPALAGLSIAAQLLRWKRRQLIGGWSGVVTIGIILVCLACFGENAGKVADVLAFGFFVTIAGAVMAAIGGFWRAKRSVGLHGRANRKGYHQQENPTRPDLPAGKHATGKFRKTVASGNPLPWILGVIIVVVGLGALLMVHNSKGSAPRQKRNASDRANEDAAGSDDATSTGEVHSRRVVSGHGTDPLKASDEQIIGAYYSVTALFTNTADGAAWTGYKEGIDVTELEDPATFLARIRMYKSTRPLEYRAFVRNAREAISMSRMSVEEYAAWQSDCLEKQRAKEGAETKRQAEEEATKKAHAAAQQDMLRNRREQLQKAYDDLIAAEAATAEARRTVAERVLPVIDAGLKIHDDEAVRAVRGLALAFEGHCDEAHAEVMLAAKHQPEGKLWRVVISRIVDIYSPDDAYTLVESMNTSKFLYESDDVYRDALEHIGDAYASRGDSSKAIQCYERKVNAVWGPSRASPSLVYKLFSSYSACGEHKKALDLAAINNWGPVFDTAAKRVVVSRTAEKAGDLDACSDWAGRALQLDANCAEALFLKARAENRPHRSIGPNELDMLRKARALGFTLPPEYAKMIGETQDLPKQEPDAKPADAPPGKLPDHGPTTPGTPPEQPRTNAGPLPDDAVKNTPKSKADQYREALNRKVSIKPPYTGLYPGAPADKLSVQYAVMSVLKQVGVPYQFKKSGDLADPERRKWITPNIEDTPAKEALEAMLGQQGLTYEVDDDGVFLMRATARPASTSPAAPAPKRAEDDF